MITAPQTRIRPRYRTVGGLDIRYAESDDPGSGEHALLLSPWPESVYAFEPTWSVLAEHAHLIAVDLPGFGRSERSAALMAPRAMGDFVARLADAFRLEQPHVVGPDVGTGAALFAAALHPGRLRTLAVGSGGSAYPLQLAGVLKEWVEAPDVEPYRRVCGRPIVEAAIGTMERYTPSDVAREDYLSAYAGERFAESMAYVRAYPTDLPVLRDLLPEIRTPVLVIAGGRDPVVPLANAEFLHERLPASRLAILDAGHFTWEDAADEYAALVRRGGPKPTRPPDRAPPRPRAADTIVQYRRAGPRRQIHARITMRMGRRNMDPMDEAAPPTVAGIRQAEVAVLAGGCFWGVEEILRDVPGVIDTEVGYTGGWLENPTYHDTHDSRSGHAEAVRVTFDPSVLPYEELLEKWFFRLHDPTTLNQQGNDVGTQYRSAIFPQTPEQRQAAERVKARVQASGLWKRPITTSIEPASTWYDAEAYHQDYLRKNPGGYTCHFLRD